ncbi:hypothetical protein [Gottfriedia acidiceleris]|uniref:Lipoprotein n=1 Tax=Gottfriedia acidiceleris TaxID=371036 RepID=A0ABY4JMV3_9BACI|nr:hypothetical protein [Gottfriedia acidiceleris]UPM55167.1 hypothetical protein MY490_04820 [Gottfriedia acidiceleris]
MSKTSKLMKKVSIALTSGIVVSSLTGCGSEPESIETTDNSQEYYESSQPVYENTKQGNEVDEGTTAEDRLDESDYIDSDETEFAYTDTEMPDEENCSDWEFDYEDNIWICDDSSSSFYRNYFFLGSFFATKNMLYSNNDFNQYKSSGMMKSKNSSAKKSGFGSGVSGGFGG